MRMSDESDNDLQFLTIDLMDNDILSFVYRAFHIIDNNGSPIVPKYIYDTLVMNVYRITLDISQLGINHKNEEQLKRQFTDEFNVPMRLLKRCLFDYHAQIYRSHTYSKFSKVLFLELAQIATTDFEILKRIKDEGFIDLTSILLQESNYYYIEGK